MIKYEMPDGRFLSILEEGDKVPLEIWIGVPGVVA